MVYRYFTALKRASALCAIAALSSLILAGSAIAERNGGVTITIHASQSKVISGAPIKIIISVANQSKYGLNVIPPDPGHAEEMVDVEVRNSKMKKLPRIDFHTIMLGGKPISWPDDGLRGGSSGVVLPGKTWTASAMLNHLFNMRKPGKYTVTASGEWMGVEVKRGAKPNKFDAESKNFAIKSNTVVITVMPKQ